MAIPALLLSTLGVACDAGSTGTYCEVAVCAAERGRMAGLAVRFYRGSAFEVADMATVVPSVGQEGVPPGWSHGRQFSATWEGFVTAGSAGLHRLRLECGLGSEMVALYVGGEQVLQEDEVALLEGEGVRVRLEWRNTQS